MLAVLPEGAKVTKVLRTFADVDGKKFLVLSFFLGWQGQTLHTIGVLTRAYISLGSNLGDRASNLEHAIGKLASLGRIVAHSAIYETEPVDVTSQPWFLNCVIALDTELTASELLSNLLSIERAMGRIRSIPKSARIIDLDILLYGDSVIDTTDLTVPHPAMHSRRFVLAPLNEIAPDAVHPLRHKTVAQLCAELPEGQAVQKVG